MPLYATNAVSSVDAHQEGQNIVITYQLSEQSDVTVSVSTNGGATYSSIKSVMGDVGASVSAGSKSVVWNVLADYEKFCFENVCFKVEGYSGFVDLGLSVKWATCNVGANAPEEYGDYFAWGETKPKDFYEWSTYKWCNGSRYKLTKYCRSSRAGRVDNKTVLDLVDDAAHVNLGGASRMPTLGELRELKDNCTWTWTKVNGVKGCTVTGPNGNSIFLPAAGYRDGSDLYNAGSEGNYWGRSLDIDGSYDACHLYFDSDNVDWNGIDLYYGQSVRPVLP